MKRERSHKKPLSKATCVLNEILMRRRGTKELPERFLIVCEDGKSSPTYFEALKKHYKLSATSVRVAGSSGGTQPIQVVSRAIELRDAAAAPNSGTEKFEHVWCVIDGDFGAVKIADARTKANANNIKLAISTMCFEYWVLLHFEQYDKSTLNCDAVIHHIKEKKHIPEYEKGKCDFKGVVQFVDEATDRAERLRKNRQELPENQNPCTEIYKLVRALLKARDKGDLSLQSSKSNKTNIKQKKNKF
jgi:hypothetical protein